MERPRDLMLLDRDGRPLETRIARVLARLLPRLRRQFPQLRDEVTLTEVMERAGARLASKERRAGSIEKLHGYAWVTLRSVATSELRRSAARLIRNTLESEAGSVRLASAPATFGTPAEVERNILLRELLATLSQEERLVCIWKKAGFSSQEIAKYQGRSAASVDTMFSRAKQKLRRVSGTSRDDRRPALAERQRKTSGPLAEDDTGTDHGTAR